MKTIRLSEDTPCLETMVDEESGRVARRIILDGDRENPVWVVYDRANNVDGIISSPVFFWTRNSVKAHFRQFNNRRREQH